MTVIYRNAGRNRALGLRYAAFALLTAAVVAYGAAQVLAAAPVILAAAALGVLAAVMCYRACLRLRIELSDRTVVIHNAFSTQSLSIDDVLGGRFVNERTGPARHAGVITATGKGEHWVRLMPLALEDVAEFQRDLSQRVGS